MTLDAEAAGAVVDPWQRAGTRPEAGLAAAVVNRCQGAGTLPDVHPAAVVVDLWRFQVSDVVPDDAVPRWPMTPYEQAQWARLRRSDDRQRFLASRLVQYAVGEFYAEAPVHIPRRCARCGEPHGRPRWQPCRPTGHGINGSGTLDYSVSHAGDQLFLAVVGAGSVGVDVESITGAGAAVDLPALDVAAGVLAHREVVDLSRTAADHQAALFLRWWTRKEAAVKAVGVGLMVGFDEIDVRGTRAVVPGGVGIGEVPVVVHLTQLDAPAGYAAALAYSSVQQTPVHHSAVQQSPVQHSAVQHSAVQHSAVQHSAVQQSPVHHGAVPRSGVGDSSSEPSAPTIRTRTAESETMSEAICRATSRQADSHTSGRR